MDYFLQTDVTLDCSIEDAFAVFCDANNLEAITPPELRIKIVSPLPIEMKVGAQIAYQIRLFGIPFSWLTEITHWEPNVRFVDEGVSGPFRVWIHEHRFESLGPSSTRIRDEIRYGLPLEPIGRIAHPWVRSRLDRIFQYRGETVGSLVK